LRIFGRRGRGRPLIVAGGNLARHGLQEFEQIFPHLAAQTPGLSGVRALTRAHNSTASMAMSVTSNLATLPSHSWPLVDDFVELAAQAVDRHDRTDPKNDSTDLRRALIGRVLERLFDKRAEPGTI
jgi:hypothetical protein